MVKIYGNEINPRIAQLDAYLAAKKSNLKQAEWLGNKLSKRTAAEARRGYFFKTVRVVEAFPEQTIEVLNTALKQGGDSSSLKTRATRCFDYFAFPLTAIFSSAVCSYLLYDAIRQNDGEANGIHK